MTRLRPWLPALIVVVALGALLITRANHAALRELRMGMEAERGQDLDGALIHYRRAASWWFPGSSTAQRGLDALERVAIDARQRQDNLAELAAVRARLSALQSRRWLSQDTQLQAVASRVSELSVQTAAVTFGERRSPEQRRSALQAQLLATDAPTLLGLLLTLLGFACWVSAAFVLPRRGFDAELQPTAAARGLGTWIVLGFGLFVLGLSLA